MKLWTRLSWLGRILVGVTIAVTIAAFISGSTVVGLAVAGVVVIWGVILLKWLVPGAGLGSGRNGPWWP